MKSHALQWVKPQPTPKQRRNRRQAAPGLEHLEDRLVPAIINVNPSNYLSLVGTAQPGDTVEFAAGNYTSWTYDQDGRQTAEYAAASTAQQAYVSSSSKGNELASWVYDNANAVFTGMADANGEETTAYAYSNGYA